MFSLFKSKEQRGRESATELLRKTNELISNAAAQIMRARQDDYLRQTKQRFAAGLMEAMGRADALISKCASRKELWSLGSKIWAEGDSKVGVGSGALIGATSLYLASIRVQARWLCVEHPELREIERSIVETILQFAQDLIAGTGATQS